MLFQERYLAMKDTLCIAKVLNHVITKHLLSKYRYAERASSYLKLNVHCQDFGASLLA